MCSCGFVCMCHSGGETHRKIGNVWEEKKGIEKNWSNWLFNQTAVFYTEHCHTIHIYTLVNMYAFVEIKEKKVKSLLLHLK